MHDGKRKGDIIKIQVMEHLERVEEARYYVDQVRKELDLTETSEQLDPALEQENADCQEEGLAEHPDFVHADPDEVNTTENNMQKSIYRKIEIPNESELKENTRSLDRYQKEVINIGIKYAKSIVKARKEGNTAPKAPLLIVDGPWRCRCWKINSD